MYDIYFDKVLLPVAPSEIKTSIKNKNKTIELINEGEVNLLKDAGLTEIAFDLLLLISCIRLRGTRMGSNVHRITSAFSKGIKQKRNLFNLSSVEHFRMVVFFYTNLKVSLEEYDIKDSVAEGFDIRVNVKLKQYKGYGTKTVTVKAVTKAPATVNTGKNRSAGAGANTSGKSYTIKSGDTLWNIAKKKLGNGARWKEIYNANKTVIENAAKKRGKASSSNGHWIWPGTVLTIP